VNLNGHVITAFAVLAAAVRIFDRLICAQFELRKLLVAGAFDH
jgi:hypothetical protein